MVEQFEGRVIVRLSCTPTAVSVEREVSGTVVVVEPWVAIRDVSLQRSILRVKSKLVRVLPLLVGPKHLLVGRLLACTMKVFISLDCVRRGFVVLHGFKEHCDRPKILDHSAILRSMAHSQLIEILEDSAMDRSRR